MRRLLKWLLILGVVVGLAAVIAVPAMSWWHLRAVPRFQTIPVSRGRVEVVVNSTGTIKPVRTISVGSYVSGPIKEIYIDYNGEVKAGKDLAVIDPKLLEAAVAHDKAALGAVVADRDRVKALLEQAHNNEDRAIRLRKINKDYISDTDLDQFIYSRKTYEAQLELSESSIKQAEATLQNSKDNLGYTHIVSPEDGVVIERKIEKGQTVASSFQTPELFVVGVEMKEHMHVYASVDEADVGLIHTAKKQKRPVRFTVDAYPGELFEGTIAQIRLNSTTTQNVVTYPVIIEAKNPEMKLMPGMTANISFETEAKENVLRVPAAALRFVPTPLQVRPEDRHYVEGQPTDPNEDATKRTASEKAEKARSRQHRHVWVQEGLLLKAVPVTLGLIENKYAELLEGDLQEGQAVVTGLENATLGR